MKTYGIDVSHHQRKIDWASTARELRRVNGGAGPGFAILRVGYSARHGKGGLILDKQWTANVAGCETNGVPMGAYFYSYDTSAEAAAATARQVVDQLRGHKWITRRLSRRSWIFSSRLATMQLYTVVGISSRAIRILAN